MTNLHLPSLCQFYNIFYHSVATQTYETDGSKEYALIGNDVLMKCSIPSFVSDFVLIVSWVDSEGVEYLLNNDYGNFDIR